MSSLNLIYRKSENIVDRTIGDETILVPIRQHSGDLENVYTLNELSSEIWSLIDGNNTVAKIVDSIVNDYEVSRAEAEEDILRTINQLEEIEAIAR